MAVSDPASPRVALVGPGRAGLTVVTALVASGARVVGVAGRGPDVPSVVDGARRFGVPPTDVATAVADADLVVIATPDAAIDAAAALVAPAVPTGALVIHLSGARGLDALGDPPCRTGALHPLQSLPSVEIGVARLAGAFAAVAGDPEVPAIARRIGLEPFTLADGARAAYHAAACIVSNHLVALMAQAAACTDVPLDVFLPLVRATVENVADLGPRDALTGPAARGDAATLAAHLAAIPRVERELYRAAARRSARLAGTEPPLTEVLR
jgi:predicted short-subunit dehydrogenase-like oxidoreductase (DUF2520 family)